MSFVQGEYFNAQQNYVVKNYNDLTSNMVADILVEYFKTGKGRECIKEYISSH